MVQSACVCDTGTTTKTGCQQQIEMSKMAILTFACPASQATYYMTSSQSRVLNGSLGLAEARAMGPQSPRRAGERPAVAPAADVLWLALGERCGAVTVALAAGVGVSLRRATLPLPLPPPLDTLAADSDRSSALVSRLALSLPAVPVLLAAAAPAPTPAPARAPRAAMPCGPKPDEVNCRGMGDGLWRGMLARG